MTIYNTKLIRVSDVATSDVETIPEIPVFYPNWSEFQDFKKLIYQIEKRGAHHMGLCKIVPPKEWIARQKGYSDLDLFIIPNPITQTTYGRDGVYLQVNDTGKSVSFKTFRQFSYNSNYITPKYRDMNELEQIYWETFAFSRPVYGANVSGTLTDSSQKIWNIANLPSILSDCLNEPIGGVNTPYLYFGSWKSTFGWHVEDMELYSINYLHFGLSKFWYVIPPPFATRFEKLVKKLFPDEFKKCSAFLRHKTVIINPNLLKKHGIPTRKIVQDENEFMVTFPNGYHSGFNTGLNIAESTNFGSPRWPQFGRRSVLCRCWSDTVQLDMSLFPGGENERKIDRHPLEMYEDVLVHEKRGELSILDDMKCYETCNYSSEDETDWMGEESVFVPQIKLEKKGDVQLMQNSSDKIEIRQLDSMDVDPELIQSVPNGSYENKNKSESMVNIQFHNV